MYLHTKKSTVTLFSTLITEIVIYEKKSWVQPYED